MLIASQLLKLIWPYLLGSAVLIVIIWFIYSKGYNNGLAEGKKRGDKALLEQQIALQNQCKSDKQLTSEVSNEYQNNLSSVDDQLERLRTGTSTSIVSVTDAGGGYHEGTERRQPIKRTIIVRDKLYGFAANCEKDRLQVKALQNFIRKAWAASGH